MLLGDTFDEALVLHCFVNGLQRVRPGVTVGQTRVAMGRDLPALAQLDEVVAAEPNNAF